MVKPGQILTLAYFFKNTGTEGQIIKTAISVPSDWKVISNANNIHLKPAEKKLSFYTLQAPANFPVGSQIISVYALNPTSPDTLSFHRTELYIQEIRDIDMLLVGAPEYIVAGERFTADFILKNLGNTNQKVFIETVNCDMEDQSEIEISPGESKHFTVYSPTSDEVGEVRKQYYTVRAMLDGQMQKSIYRSFTIFPAKGQKKDLFFRFPVSASATYLTSNQQDKVESTYQFQLSGSGSLDPQGKHQLEFLARGPNNTNLSFLGLYDQYYISYANKNVELFVGEKSYQFTPLTESSRYGMGVENKIKLNNGLYFGGLFVKPRFYEDIESEFAGYAGFEFNKENDVSAFYISKKDKFSSETAQLASVNTRLQPIKGTGVELEFSRGFFKGIGDNAFRTFFNSEIWIFQLAANYFYAGKNYPGYYRNSTFYSGNLSANLTKNISISLYAKEDFRNAELDTFFVTAPFSKSLQAMLNYNLVKKAHLKFYWRDFEREDRLEKGKFHYRTRSLNTQFNHRFKKIEYNLLGEFGKTSNLLLKTQDNEQNTFRASADFAYRFNSRYSVRSFGSWSNVNSFVSGEQRNLTAGMSMNAQITGHLNAGLHVQNAFDIDDYYRNRNLMQLNLQYDFLRHHSLALHSFYTLFRQQVDKPEFTASISYVYKFGVPLKQIIKAGDLNGRITNDSGEAVEGIVLNLQNKTAITDKNGNFWFRTIEPGQHLLFVDRAKFEMNELTDIPSPIKIEIIEDRESTVNFKITRGTKLKGQIQLGESKQPLSAQTEATAGNIIVEMKNEFEQFRITTDKDGMFSFPIVRPGNWVFKIYPNSIPNGYTLDKTVFNLNLDPGEEKTLDVELTPKIRKIIFKSGATLTPTVNAKMPDIESVKPEEQKNRVQHADSIFYSVQIGAFNRPIDRRSAFFKGEQFDFEIEIDNFYKYFIGHFETVEAAMEEQKRLAAKFSHPFVVKLKDRSPVPEIQSNE